MSICCTVCGLWYHTEGRDTLDICPPCFAMNFAAAQPPLDAWGTARLALEAYVDASVPCRPRQVQAMARLQARWEAEATRRTGAGEDT